MDSLKGKNTQTEMYMTAIDIENNKFPIDRTMAEGKSLRP